LSKVAEGLGPADSKRLREAARIVGWGLLLYAGVLLVGAKLQAKAVGALALQMVIAEWGAGRLGVAWSDPEADIPTLGALVSRAWRGAAMGLGVGAWVLVFALVTHGSTFRPASFAAGPLALGVATAALLAARDELLLRGVVIRAYRHACPPVVLALLCGGVGAAADYGMLAESGDATPAHLVVAGLLAMAFAAVWLVDRGGWMAFGAHTAWTTLTGVATQGALVDLRPTPNEWGGGGAGTLGSLATAVALLPVAAFTLQRLARLSSRDLRGP
jgi:hypothetical protein